MASTCKGCGAEIEWRRKRSGWVSYLDGKPHGACYRAWKKLQDAQANLVRAEPTGAVPRSKTFQRTDSGLKIALSRKLSSGWTR